MAQVVGLDPAPAAVAAAREHVAGRGLTNVRIDVGDVYALDAPDGTYDVVHAHQVLQHLADPVAALREMRRVCRPGGLVAVPRRRLRDHDLVPRDRRRWTRWLALYEDLARRNGGEPDAGRRLKAWALEAGFTDVTATGSVWCYASPEDLAWWTGTWAERLTASVVRHLGRWRTGSPTPPSSSSSPRAGAPSAPTRGPGSSCRTARSSPVA